MGNNKSLPKASTFFIKVARYTTVLLGEAMQDAGTLIELEVE